MQTQYCLALQFTAQPSNSDYGPRLCYRRSHRRSLLFSFFTSHDTKLDDAAACGCDFCGTAKVLDVIFSIVSAGTYSRPLMHGVVVLYLVLYCYSLL